MRGSTVFRVIPSFISVEQAVNIPDAKTLELNHPDTKTLDETDFAAKDLDEEDIATETSNNENLEEKHSKNDTEKTPVAHSPNPPQAQKSPARHGVTGMVRDDFMLICK